MRNANLRHALLCATAAAWLLPSTGAHAQFRHDSGTAPDVEVHLEALDLLRASLSPVSAEAPLSTQESGKLVWQKGLPGQKVAETPPAQPAVKKEVQHKPPTQSQTVKAQQLLLKQEESKQAQALPAEPPPHPAQPMDVPPSAPVAAPVIPETHAADHARPAVMAEMPPAPVPQAAPPEPEAPQPTPRVEDSHPAEPIEAPVHAAIAEPQAAAPQSQLLGHIEADTAPPGPQSTAMPPVAAPVETPPAPPEEKHSMLSGISTWFGGHKSAPPTSPVEEKTPETPIIQQPPAEKLAEPAVDKQHLETPPASVTEPPPMPQAIVEKPANPTIEKQAAEPPPPAPAPAMAEPAPKPVELTQAPPEPVMPPSAPAHGEQQASLTPAPAAAQSQTRVIFAANETTVTGEMKDQLNGLAARMKKEDNLRLSLVAHASGTTDQMSTARRVSLARALAVRAYLIDQGVDNLRINVQAEGNKDAGDQPDRVDVMLMSPAKG